jgi:hypothetical protein
VTSRNFCSPAHRLVCTGLVAVAGLIFATPFAHAQYQIGSSAVATADPTITRPTTKPCVVNLFTNDEFDNFNNMPFNFTPPANCPGPYAKIVLTGDYYITAGVQFDRTSEVFLNNVNIFFGTTPEPINVNDPWHFERDLTSYAGLFKTASTGFASLGNVVDSTYTGVIYGTVNVYFYPTNGANPAGADQSDVAIPLLASQGGSVQLNATTPSVTAAVTLPTNLERLYMDVVAQSQNDEEQWFTCLPADEVSLSIDGCPNTAFREVEVTIDGVPAGIAPVSPWIYTGGIDPYLWLPIPGAQTLNFTPYRVDLSPFAGKVSDGQPHSVGIELYNAYQYFTVTGSLLGYEDHGSTQTSGSIVRNTLTAPNPKVVENISTDGSGNETGNISVTSDRGYSIVGKVNTSHGTVVHTLDTQITFASNSNLANTATKYEQAINQQSAVNTLTATEDNGATTYTEQNWSFPIVFSLIQVANSDGSYTQTTNSQQNWTIDTEAYDGVLSNQVATNRVHAQDVLSIVPCSGGYCLGGNSGQKSNQVYFDTNFTTACYFQEVTAANNALTAEYTIPLCAGRYGNSTPAIKAEAANKPAHLTTNLQGEKLRTAEAKKDRWAN